MTFLAGAEQADPFSMAQINSAADSHEIRPLTGIRGFAALLVVAYHFFSGWLVLLPSLRWLTPLAVRGYIGVDIFFMLSGFILCYIYNVAGRDLTVLGYGRFLWFRLARVYPNHIATLLVLVLVSAAASRAHFHFAGSYPWNDLPYQLTLTHAWPIAPETGVSVWNYPSWSISAEWFAYLLMFPLSIVMIRRITRPWMALVAGIILASPVPALAAALLHVPLLFDSRPLLQVSIEFLAGALIFRAYLGGGWVVHVCQKRLTPIFAILIGSFYLGSIPMILLVIPALLLGLTSEGSRVGRFFSLPWTRWLGRISYALYMSHALAQKMLKFVLPIDSYFHSSLIIRAGVVALHLATILLFAAVLYYTVEQPMRNLMRRYRPAFLFS